MVCKTTNCTRKKVEESLEFSQHLKWNCANATQASISSVKGHSTSFNMDTDLSMTNVINLQHAICFFKVSNYADDIIILLAICICN